jgi:hypothetical protein
VVRALPGCRLPSGEEAHITGIIPPYRVPTSLPCEAWKHSGDPREGRVVHRLGLDRLFVALKPGEVASVLVGLADRLGIDLTPGRINRFCAELLDEESEDDPLLEGTVQYEGQTVPLVFEYIRDWEAADELMILGPPPVVQDVQRVIALLSPTAGLRLIEASPDGRG